MTFSFAKKKALLLQCQWCEAVSSGSKLFQLLFRKPYSLLDDTRNESQQGPIPLDKKEKICSLLAAFKGIFPSFSTCFSITSAPWKRARGTSLLIKRIDRKKEWVGLIHDLNHSHLLFVVKLIPRSLHQMSLFYAFMVERLNQDK